MRERKANSSQDGPAPGVLSSLLDPFTVLIKPPRARLHPDPFISPVRGKHGPCALCGHYSKLTENHVPPESVGNDARWHAKSYLTVSTAASDQYFERTFPSGLRFKTLCGDCNNRLGGREDKAIGDFFGSVRKFVESPLFIRSTVRVAAKPNLIYRGLLAHIVSANDNGVPSTFDLEARELFSDRKPLRQSSWNLFYWVYNGPDIFLMRHAYFALWHPTVKLIDLQVLKLYPLAFMFAKSPWFGGHPSMRWFLQSRDDDETEVPINLARIDTHPYWPVAPDRQGIVFLAGNSFGLLGRRD